MYRSYEYYCELCSHCEIEVYKKSEQPDVLDCAACGAEASMIEVFGMPNVVGKASFLDGVDRGDGWRLAKESAKLEHEAVKASKRKRGAEAAELKKESLILSHRAANSKQKT